MKALIPLALLASIGTAAAQPRLSTTEIPCGQARALVGRQGAIVLGTGGPTYDRFVRDQGFCERDETIRQAFVPALDTPQCPVGYRCIQPERRRFLD
ncbi:hypothetical protein [Salinarimonas soli]|uniref:Secreted protein n=1 Tax=Salinarimonas soli TaxID=1638099 RepID=A0A5B2VE34_9HYPH|nr:hypothetical protein [Salinarimonas soli]KAA2237793.1 hypothetical protein F0L46_08970 [Salinarimonas soli]